MESLFKLNVNNVLSVVFYLEDSARNLLKGVIMLEKIKVGNEYLENGNDKVKVIFISTSVIVYEAFGKDHACTKEYALNYWSEIPKEKTKCKLIVWKFNSCARLNKSVNFTDKQHLCNNYRKELSDLEFYHEMELENQL